MEGDDLKMFIYDNSSGNNYSIVNTWNDQGFFVSGDLGYINNALYQTLSMSTEIYNEGFNARYGFEVIPKSKFNDSYNITSSNMVIAIPDYSWGFKPEYLSEIIAYDTNGNMVGSSVYNNGPMSITIWEDDIFTDKKDGMIQDEIFTLKYWDEESNRSVNIDVEWELGGNNYISNGLAAISSITLSKEIPEKNFLKLFPNPCNNYTNLSFYLPLDNFVDIEIFDLQGNKVFHPFSEKMSKGMKNVNLNTSQIKPGSYVISLKSDIIRKEILFSKF